MLQPKFSKYSPSFLCRHHIHTHGFTCYQYTSDGGLYFNLDIFSDLKPVYLNTNVKSLVYLKHVHIQQNQKQTHSLPSPFHSKPVLISVSGTHIYPHKCKSQKVMLGILPSPPYPHPHIPNPLARGLVFPPKHLSNFSSYSICTINFSK